MAFVCREVINASSIPVDLTAVQNGIQTFNYYHVLVTLCNVLFSNVLFTGKLMALACSILGTYYVILSHDVSPMLLIFFGSLSFQAIAFYTVSCQKLFGVPDALATLKQHCNMMVNKKQSRLTAREKKVLQYRIEVMPKVGIKDGGFRILKSESTLLFVDFYLNTVISLLLM